MYSCPAHCVLWRRFWEHTPWMMMISGATPIPLTCQLTQQIVKKWWGEATEFYTNKHEESVPTELLNKVSNVPKVCDAVQKCQLDPLNKSKNLIMLFKKAMWHTQIVSISWVKKIKTTTNMINNSWAVNMVVVEDGTTETIHNPLFIGTQQKPGRKGRMILPIGWQLWCVE